MNFGLAIDLLPTTANMNLQIILKVEYLIVLRGLIKRILIIFVIIYSLIDHFNSISLPYRHSHKLCSFQSLISNDLFASCFRISLALYSLWLFNPVAWLFLLRRSDVIIFDINQAILILASGAIFYVIDLLMVAGARFMVVTNWIMQKFFKWLVW